MEVWSVRERPEKVGEFISYFQEKWADAYSGAMYRDCLLHTPGAPGRDIPAFWQYTQPRLQPVKNTVPLPREPDMHGSSP